MEHGGAVSGRARGQQDHHRADTESARGLAAVHRARRRHAHGRHRALQAGRLRHPGRFPGLRRQARQDVRSRSRCEGAGAPERGRRRSALSRSQARASGAAPQSRAAGLQAVRLASLRPLRLPVLAFRPDVRQRPGASALQRERHGRGLFQGLGPEGRHRRSAAARVHAFVERQVPPPGGTAHAELQRADAGRPALGLRRANPVLGQCARLARGPAHAVAVARRVGAGRRHLRR